MGIILCSQETQEKSIKSKIRRVATLKSISSNKIQIKKNTGIGESCAEDDERYLQSCFIEKHEIENVLSFENNSSIILGRTGTGKTAIINQIKNDSQYYTRALDPEALFFQYVSNSKTFDFFLAMGANLDVIFSLLWKHIILVESIKLYFESRSALEKTFSQFNSKSRNLSRYLDKWEADFWSNSEVSMKEIVEKLESNLSARAGVEASQIKLGAKGALNYAIEEKLQVRQNIMTAVNTPIYSLLHKAIEDLNSLTSGKASSFYIVIDELDENWIVDDFKYRLLRALLESIRKFRKVRRLKVIVAMRNDLYERTIAETSEAGFQAEKHKGLIEEISWTREELFKLVDTRISMMFEWKYTKKSVGYYDIFSRQVRKIDSFDYINKRTLGKPRDIIEFVNEIFKVSSGSIITLGANQISQKNIFEAEKNYSAERKQAVEEEWSTIHPQLSEYINIIYSLKENFSFENVTIDQRLDEIALTLSTNNLVEIKDHVRIAADKYLEISVPKRKNQLKQEIFAVLYKVGVLSVKLTAKSGYQNSMQNKVILQSSAISLSTKFAVNPMFWNTLGITPNM